MVVFSKFSMSSLKANSDLIFSMLLRIITGWIRAHSHKGKSQVIYCLFNYFFLIIWGFTSLCTGHITKSSFMGKGNHYIQLVKVLYCKLPTIRKKLQSFPHRVQSLKRRTPKVGGKCVTFATFTPQAVYCHDGQLTTEATKETKTMICR